MNRKPLGLWVQAIVSRAAESSKKSLCLFFVLFSAAQAFAYTDGELLIWIGSNRAFHALSDIGKTFEEEVGAPVKVETQEKIIDKAIVIMWDYKTPYFSWPFLASAGGYPFKKTAEGCDVQDIGVANPGALEGLKAIVELINTGILPKGSTQSVMGEKWPPVSWR
jgi:maltose-binding protein MalE